MPSKLLILDGEEKSYCLTVSSVPKSMFNHQFYSDFHCFDMLRIKYNKNKKGVADKRPLRKKKMKKLQTVVDK